MNRDAMIAHLILHGYTPYANPHGWMAIWNGSVGRLCKFFEDTEDGPAWDVRPIISDLALHDAHEVPWHRIDDGALARFVAAEVPPKVKHKLRVPDNLDVLDLS